MHDIGLLALRGLAGGLLVVVFALIAEVLKPKIFSGLFSAAPSIAIAGLLVTAFTKRPPAAADAATGMIGGAVAMIACTVVAAYTVERFGSIPGSVLAWLTWLATAAVVYVGFLR
jgi:hypothetical protein